MKAILLEPDAQRRRLVSDALIGENHELTTVESAAELIAAQHTHGHPLVFVAAETVHHEGLRLCQQLRAPGVGGNCVIFAIADDGHSELRDLLAAGVDDVLVAPWNRETVTLRTTIAGHRLRRGLRRERWFEALIALGSTVYLVTDERGVVQYASPSASAVSGWATEDLIGKPVFEFLLADEIDGALHLLEETIAAPGRIVQARLRCWFKDGTAGILEVSAVNRLDDPLIGGIVLTAQDMTKEWAIESALELTEARYRTLVETAREGIAICDPDENLLFVNPALASILGYRREELVGMNLSQLTDSETFLRFRRATAERRAGVSSRDEIQLVTSKGEARQFSFSAAPLFDNAGHFTGTLGLLFDVTEQKRADEKLRTSEQRYRLIAENVSDIIWTHHLSEPAPIGEPLDHAAALESADRLLNRLQVTYVSPSVTQMLGYGVAEAMALSIDQLLAPASAAHLRQALAAALVAKSNPAQGLEVPELIELECRTKQGATRWGEVTGTTFFDEQRRLTGTLAVMRDVNERKHVERALRESEFRLRRLIENMPDLVILVDGGAQIQYVNRGVGTREPKQLVGQSGFSFLLDEHQAACQEAFATAVSTGEVQIIEAGDIFGYWWSCRLVPLVDPSRSAQVMIICTDFTEQRLAAEEVRREQDLLRQLLELHERDRKLLAFELHDGFAQQLTGAMMSLEAAIRFMTSSSPERASDAIREGTRLLRESIAESRRLVSGLRPPVLDQFGIVPAVEHLVDLGRQDGECEITFVSRGRPRRLAAPLENAVFRIVQETLTNARRHSRSERVMVELQLADDLIRLVVTDWGTGFDLASACEGRFGLRGIRERARLLGGHAEISSVPGEGTRIEVRLPMIERGAEEVAAAENGDDWHDGLSGTFGSL